MSDGRVEILTGRERRRRRSAEDKLRIVAETEGKREPNSTFPDAGVTAMLGSMIEMDGWGDGRGVVRGS
jgi:hypothetical protein